MSNKDYNLAVPIAVPPFLFTLKKELEEKDVVLVPGNEYHSLLMHFGALAKDLEMIGNKKYLIGIFDRTTGIG